MFLPHLLSKWSPELQLIKIWGRQATAIQPSCFSLLAVIAPRQLVSTFALSPLPPLPSSMLLI
jgi:hypothetical protein